jgi:proteasome activator subunit 4
MIGELTNPDNTESTGTATPTLGVSTPPVNPRKMLKIPSFNLKGVGFFAGEGDAVEVNPRRSKRDEDADLVETTGSFADWVASFIRRVILLLENLPEEGLSGNYTSGQSETQIIDAVTGACSQICVHLSEPFYDLVLNMVGCGCVNLG